jgi:hypothetical protein
LSSTKGTAASTSSGAETRFTNGYDPDARSRRAFSFHRPETLVEWMHQIKANPEAPTFRTRLRDLPELGGHSGADGTLIVCHHPAH